MNLENNKFSRLKTDLIGFGSFFLIGLYLYFQLDHNSSFKSISYCFGLLMIATIIIGVTTQRLYDKGFRINIIENSVDFLLHFCLYLLLFVPIVFINKIAFNLAYIVFSGLKNSTVFNYFIILPEFKLQMQLS